MSTTSFLEERDHGNAGNGDSEKSRNFLPKGISLQNALDHDNPIASRSHPPYFICNSIILLSAGLVWSLGSFSSLHSHWSRFWKLLKVEADNILSYDLWPTHVHFLSQWLGKDFLLGLTSFPQTQRSLKISVGQYIDLDIIHTHIHTYDIHIHIYTHTSFLDTEKQGSFPRCN